jgi:hypothetical protein
MAKQFDAWSYSRLAAYEQCPLQAKLKFLDKIKEPDSPAMKRGSDIHLGIANFLQGKAEGVPREALNHPKVEQLIVELGQFPEALVEQQWGFTSSWQPTGWFGGDTWFRSIMDVGVLYEDMTGEAVDWKTGKRYGSNMDQMKSQAIAMFGRFKPLIRCTVRLAYLDTANPKDNPFDIADIQKHEIPTIQRDFEKRVAKMFSDTVFAPRPNEKCHFCSFSRSKGGQCAFG